MKPFYSQQVEVEEKVSFETLLGHKSELILFDDDFNTFDFVIDTLVELCDHSIEQAEQCTLLVHYKGKCAVKLGSKEELKPICSAMGDRGLTAQIT